MTTATAAARSISNSVAQLIRFFEWRGCPFPEEHADETFNRIARRVAEGEQLQNPSGYAMGVARLLVLEIIKSRQREQEAMNEITPVAEAAAGDDDDTDRIECLQGMSQRPAG